VTNSPVFPEHVLLSLSWLFFIKWWKCPGFKKKTALKDQLYTAKYRWANNEDEEEKQDKRKKTRYKYILLFRLW